MQTWLTDKSRYKLKQANQPQQPSRGNIKPRAVFFTAGTQTDDMVFDLNQEAEIEEERNQQEYQAIVAETLDLGGEDCDRNSDDRDSGLESVSEDEF